MKYCGIIDYENGMDCMADVIALVGQEEEELAQSENNWIDSDTAIIADVYNSFMEAYSIGYSIDGLVFTELSEAERKLIVRVFLELK